MQTKQKILIPLFVFPPMFLAGTAPYALADSLDVFPLVRGLHCVYHYTKDATAWNWSSDGWSRDSGVVEYAVIDSSTLNDTTLSWTIAERATLQRTWFRHPLPDSVFTVVDSSLLTLTEFTTGRHELRCPGIIWAFGPSHVGFPVFRFLDSAQLITASYGPSCRFVPTNYDSLSFSSDSTLHWRASSRCWDQDETGYADWQHSQLLSRVVLSVDDHETVPNHAWLLPNYPNPFNSATTVTYVLDKRSEVLLEVYDLLGRRVALLARGVYEAGRHRHSFAAGEHGSGIYILRLQTANAIYTAKMILLK